MAYDNLFNEIVNDPEKSKLAQDAQELHERFTSPGHPQQLRDMLVQAEALACIAHDEQFRRDGVTPYIEHPKAVAAHFPNDPYAAAVAWLHDVVEDTYVTFKHIRDAGMPINVVCALGAITKIAGEDYNEYLERVLADPIARRVKFVDMLCNLADNPTEKQRLKYTKALARFLPLIGDTRD